MKSKTATRPVNHRSACRTLLGTAIILAIVTPLIAQQKKQVSVDEPFHPTRIIAKFKAKEKTGLQHPVLKQQGLKAHRQYNLLPQVMVLDLADEAQVKAVNALTPQARAKGLQDRITALKSTGLFEYVEPDYVRKLNLEPTDSAYTNGTLWALHNTGQNGGVPGADIGAVPAWDIATGSTNVIVAIIDTGIRYTHQELVGQVWRNPGEIAGNGVDDDGDGYADDVFGINATLDPKGNAGAGDPNDDNGHGTHVAGTIGAAANDGNPHVGVAWNVRLMACKFLNSAGNGYVSDEVECIAYAVARGARIINASFGSSGYSQPEFDAICAAGEMGVLFVAAAGNSAASNDTGPMYPASYQLGNILSVAALDRLDRVAHFSNVGSNSVHLGAPGVQISSCFNGSDSDYRTLDGTSMATPHVCGVAALVLAANPAATMEEVKQRLLVGAVPIRALQGLAISGGRVNAYNSLAANHDGVMEVSVSPPGGAVLSAHAVVPVFVHVSDLYDLTNALVTATVSGSSNLVFHDDGVLPDVVANDGIYSTLASVPAASNAVTLTILATSLGKANHTNTVTYVVLAPPVNDDFTNRIVLTGISNDVIASNVAATKEAGEPGEPNAGGRTLWWSWTAPASGWLTASTVGSTFDTILTVYTGNDLTNLSQIAVSTRNYWLDDTMDATSELNCPVTAGTTYQVAVDGFRNAVGDVVLRLTHFSQPPPNDNFADRATLTGTNITAAGVNLLATMEADEPYLWNTDGGHSVWWTWTAPANGRVTISTAGSDYDTVMGVYTGSELSNLVLQAYSDDVNYPYILTSAVVFDVAAGTEYQIAVNGYYGSIGNIQLNLALTVAASNDHFADRIALSGTNVTVSGWNLGATLEPGEPVHGYSGGHSVWWTWTAPANGRMNIWVGSPQFGTEVNVYTGYALTNLAQVVRTGGALTNGTGFDVAAGVTYQIAVAGYDGTGSGDYTLGLAFLSAPANDNFADRFILDGTNVTVSGSNVGATLEPGEPRFGYYWDNNLHSVWWSWTAPTNGRVSLWVGSSTFNTAVGIYMGSAVTNLVGVASAGNWSLTNNVALDVQAGVTYQIAVDGFSSGSFGDFQLGLAFTSGPANDNFADRFILDGTNVTASGSNVGATLEPGEPRFGYYWDNNLHSVWWSWRATSNGRVTLQIGSANFATAVAAFTGDSVSNLVGVASIGGGQTNTLGFDVVAETTYQIAVDGYTSGSFGSYQLDLAFTPSPANDHFDDRYPLDGTNVTVSGSNVGATKQPGEPDHWYWYTTSHSVWWTWTAPTNGRVNLDAWSTNFTSAVGVYTGTSVSNLSTVVKSYGTLPNHMALDVQAGVSYQIAVDGYDAGQFGLFLLDLSFTPAPANDNFADRYVLGGTNLTVSGSNLGATMEAGEPGHGK